MVPRWVDREEFPFIVHTFDSRDGRMAYIDEGEGPTLLLLHGNASWSFLYRSLIKSLREDFRCIAVDHLGLGLSDKPLKADYSPQGHLDRLDAFIEYLQLGDLTLLGHDYGGPIGLGWAIQNADRVRGLVLFNTWLWSLRGNPAAMHLFRTFDNFFNRYYYTHLRASPKFFLPVLVADAHEMPKHVMEQYMFPFSEHRSRQAAYAFAQHLIRSSDWFDRLWSQREAIDHIPMLLLWGQNDALSGEAGLARFVEHFPMARPLQLEHTGNFVPQDAHRRTAVEIRGFLRSLDRPAFWPGFMD